MKLMKALLAVALASQLFLACSSSNSNNSNASNSNNSNANSNSKNTSTPSNANSTSKANTNSESSSTDSSGATHYTHKEGGIQFDSPAGWKAEPKDDQITLSTADSTVSVVIYVASEDNFNEATEAIDKELSKIIKNVKSNGEPKETTVAGMKAVNLNGTGEVNGNEIQWAVDLIQAKKPVIVLTFSAPGASDKHESEYKQFASSIKPA